MCYWKRHDPQRYFKELWNDFFMKLSIAAKYSSVSIREFAKASSEFAKETKKLLNERENENSNEE